MSDIFVTPLKPKIEGQRTRTLAEFARESGTKITGLGETTLGDGHQVYFKVPGVGRLIIGIKNGESAIIGGHYFQHKER